MVATDRISAFDVVLPKGIPFKGQVLNQTAGFFLDATADVAPNWKLSEPDPMVTAGQYCRPFPVEMVVRGYLAGHAWREYKAGKREICGIGLPEGLRENDPLPHPIITPTTKAVHGHDTDISRNKILSNGLVSKDSYSRLEELSLALFEKGSEMAGRQGLILVDTKYEFGQTAEGDIRLIDEIHTPDSSRYFYSEGYQERQSQGIAQQQLSKEFLREWLIANNFMGRPGDLMPEISETLVKQVSKRYIHLYEQITGREFKACDTEGAEERIRENCIKFIETL